MEILTGVFSGNSLSGDFLDRIICNGINLDYEAYIDENGEDSADDYCGDGDTYLLGFMKNADGKYDVDENADISAIYNSNHNTVQVVRSHWVFTDARMCSPCYPNQADMDSVGGGVVGYSVDPEDFNEYASDEELPVRQQVKHISEMKEESS